MADDELPLPEPEETPPPHQPEEPPLPQPEDPPLPSPTTEGLSDPASKFVSVGNSPGAHAPPRREDAKWVWPETPTQPPHTIMGVTEMSRPPDPPLPEAAEGLGEARAEMGWQQGMPREEQDRLSRKWAQQQREAEARWRRAERDVQMAGEPPGVAQEAVPWGGRRNDPLAQLPPGQGFQGQQSGSQVTDKLDRMLNTLQQVLAVLEQMRDKGEEGGRFGP